jgi:hypothetical protein
MTGCDDRLVLNYFVDVENIQFQIYNDGLLQKLQASLKKLLHKPQAGLGAVSTNFIVTK